jgi:prevent-host-death family protein
MRYSLSEAKARLSELVDQATQGHEVIITRHGKPVVRLDPIVVRSGRLGRHRGQVEVPPDERFRAITPEMADAFWEGR